MPWRENKGVANLDGCFWGLLRKKSLEEIFNEIWPLARNLSSEFKRILDGCFWGCFARCFVVTQHSESRVSHSVFATPKHLAKQHKIKS